MTLRRLVPLFIQQMHIEHHVLEVTAVNNKKKTDISFCRVSGSDDMLGKKGKRMKKH